jgi:hypothetical protein
MADAPDPQETVREKVEREKAEREKAEREAQATRRMVAEAFANGAVVEARKAAVAAGTEAIKLVAAFNAGGLIALLGFLGAIAGKPSKVIYGTGVFETPMIWLGSGLLLGAISLILLYFARHFFAEAWLYTEPLDMGPYYKPTGNRAERHEELATCLLVAHQLCSVLAFICFIIGMATSLAIVHRIQL